MRSSTTFAERELRRRLDRYVRLSMFLLGTFVGYITSAANVRYIMDVVNIVTARYP